MLVWVLYLYLGLSLMWLLNRNLLIPFLGALVNIQTVLVGILVVIIIIIIISVWLLKVFVNHIFIISFKKVIIFIINVFKLFLSHVILNLDIVVGGNLLLFPWFQRFVL